MTNRPVRKEQTKFVKYPEEELTKLYEKQMRRTHTLDNDLVTVEKWMLWARNKIAECKRNAKEKTDEQ